MEFKKGDKVKIINKESCNYGNIGHIEKVDEPHILGLTHKVSLDISTYEWCKESELELLEDLPEKYEEVEVSYDGSEVWYKRLFLCINDKRDDYKYVAVSSDYDCASSYQKMRRIQQPEEMTMEEVCKELGREIKIKKG